jgi:hypothetical protein
MAVNKINNLGFNKNSQPDQTAISSGILNAISELSNFIVTARVTDIVLNENHPYFKNVGEYNGIGAIFYELVNQSGTNTDLNESKNFAIPYDPQLKTYPLINEYVLLIKIPNNQTGGLSSSTSYFYLNPINIWNHPHHDAYPNPLTLPENSLDNTSDYTSLEAVSGSVRRVGDDNEYLPDSELNSKKNDSQFTFIEKANIHPLMPFMGDVLLEGRHGQSFRFGSTARAPQTAPPIGINNNWSSTGENGDPITIIRNGQPADSTDEGWIPITEDLNRDLSSIYLTSTQQLSQFTLANNIFNSYGNSQPTTPSQYTSPQILLNSNNIVINSKQDNIFLNSKSSISLSSVRSVNVDSPQTVIQSNEIFLGDINAPQRGVLGDNLYTNLMDVINTLITLTRVLKVTQTWPGGLPVTDGGMAVTADDTLSQLNQVKDKLKNILSTSVKLK